MQPYFFPYIGYFQLMRAVDVFVMYDDAQYMKGGWINRNRILVNGNATWLTLPTRRASVTLPINQRSYLLADHIASIKQQLSAAYANAPRFKETFAFICDLLDFNEQNVAKFNSNLLLGLATKLGLSCTLISSSSMDKSPNMKGSDKVIDICHRIGAKQYINPIGGSALYDPAVFSREGVQLRFLEGNASSYAQFGGPQVPSLSIIDVLMFNSIERVQGMLDSYTIVTPACTSIR